MQLRPQAAPYNVRLVLSCCMLAMQEGYSPENVLDQYQTDTRVGDRIPAHYAQQQTSTWDSQVGTEPLRRPASAALVLPPTPSGQAPTWRFVYTVRVIMGMGFVQELLMSCKRIFARSPIEWNGVQCLRRDCQGCCLWLPIFHYASLPIPLRLVRSMQELN